MPEMPPSGKTLFITLAHQDDELLLAPLLLAVAPEDRANCAFFYFTNGALPSSPPGTRARRNAETLSGLAAMGFSADRVFFLADPLPANDQGLCDTCDQVYERFRWAVSDLPRPDLILTTAFEGGHPDHDVTQWMTRVWHRLAAPEAGLHQFFLYHKADGYAPPFRIVSPPPRRRTSGMCFGRSRLVRYAFLLACYPSQWRTFVVLGPLILLRWLWRPVVDLESLEASLPEFERPQAAPLLYETRKWASFETIRKRLAASRLWREVRTARDS